MIRTIFLLLFLCGTAHAQTINGISGQLLDTLGKQKVLNATISLVKSGDSSLQAFTRSDEDGNFSFKNIRAGEYRLVVSHVNFHPLSKNVIVSGTGIDLGPVLLRDKSLLADVTVLATRPPVVINGDTLEFNAESFKTKPNAVVEDMLKKMPGVEIDKDGTIRINGQRINRVMVNGKDFFNGDPRIATRNLAADAVDKVQVYDRQSEQAAFTGVDDGNSEKTINLKLKKDKKNAAFGKATAAAGTGDRYDGQFNINRFNNEQQLSAIGMINNTNRQGFSIMDMLNFTGQNRRMMGGGGGMVINTGGPQDFGLPVQGINNSQGITRTLAGGLNYSDTWRKKTDVNSSYLYNNLALTNNRNSLRQNLVPGNIFNTSQNTHGINVSESNRFNLSLDHKIDSFNSLRFTTQLGYQAGVSYTENLYGSFIPGDKQLNSGISENRGYTAGKNMNNTFLARHKFSKKGRTISLNVTMQYNNSRGKNNLNSINNFYDNGSITKRDTIDQRLDLRSLTSSYGATLTYTEPLSKRSLLELRSSYTFSEGNLNRKTYDYNKNSGKHDLMNSKLSNAFKNEYNYGGGGASIRVQQKKYNFSAGANIQQATLVSQLTDSNFNVKKNYTDVLPLALFVYNFSRTKNLRFEYNSSTQAPSAAQLQPVKDVSNPLYIRQGNPDLRQEYNRNISFRYFSGNPGRRQSFFAFVNYSTTNNAIVSSDKLSATGIRTSTPVNASGVYNILATAEKGFPITKLNTRLGIGGNLNYNHSVNYINSERNNAANLSFTSRLSANYSYKETIEVSAIARLTYNETKYSLLSLLNDVYVTHRYNLDATLNLPFGISISNEINYTGYTGRLPGYNTSATLWNGSVSKQVLKSKKGELRFSAFDLLRQQKGIDRESNSNYIEDASYETLSRYFTLGFTYNLQKPVVGGPRAVIRTF